MLSNTNSKPIVGEMPRAWEEEGALQPSIISDIVYLLFNSRLYKAACVKGQPFTNYSPLLSSSVIEVTEEETQATPATSETHVTIGKCRIVVRRVVIQHTVFSENNR
jgi:hypothetical protein